MRKHSLFKTQHWLFPLFLSFSLSEKKGVNTLGSINQKSWADKMKRVYNTRRLDLRSLFHACKLSFLRDTIVAKRPHRRDSDKLVSKSRTSCSCAEKNQCSFSIGKVVYVTSQLDLIVFKVTTPVLISNSFQFKKNYSRKTSFTTHRWLKSREFQNIFH